MKRVSSANTHSFANTQRSMQCLLSCQTKLPSIRPGSVEALESCLGFCVTMRTEALERCLQTSGFLTVDQTIQENTTALNFAFTQRKNHFGSLSCIGFQEKSSWFGLVAHLSFLMGWKFLLSHPHWNRWLVATHWPCIDSSTYARQWFFLKANLELNRKQLMLLLKTSVSLGLVRQNTEKNPKTIHMPFCKKNQADRIFFVSVRDAQSKKPRSGCALRRRNRRMFHVHKSGWGDNEIYGFPALWKSPSWDLAGDIYVATFAGWFLCGLVWRLLIAFG